MFNNSIEEWKWINDSFYQISSFGNIRSFSKKMNGKLIKVKTSLDGYKRIPLFINGKQKSFTIHRLVAEYFIPNPNKYKTVNHKNCNKSDNRVLNLEWLSLKDNIQDSYIKGLNKSSLNKNKVIEIRRLLSSGYKQIEIAKKFNVNYRTIGFIKSKRFFKYV